MTGGRTQTPTTAAAFEAAGPAGDMAVLAIGAFHPVRSRWTWQPRLPELWLREQEGHRLSMMIAGRKKEA